MSAEKKELIYINVTNGDAVIENKKSGKSNTGTYFVSSLKDFDYFEDYLDSENFKTYTIDSKKVFEYKEAFKSFFMNDRNDFPDNMDSFEEYCNSLIENENPFKISIGLRINDSRVFMRFEENVDVVANVFRRILYPERSIICLERRGNNYFIYPIINSDLIDIN